MYGEILVPLDGSELSKAALPHARELAKAFGAHITLLTVVEPVCRACSWATDPYTLTAVQLAVGREEQREAEIAERFLREARDELAREGITAECKVLAGDPGSEICDWAQAIKADLIVMSTHGRSGIQRWVYGSVAEKVLRGADVPILLVRASIHT